MKPKVAIVGLIYDVETPFTQEVKETVPANSDFKTERILYVDHNYQKLFNQFDCHLAIISPDGDHEVVTNYDMIVLPGGPDVDPAHYDQKRHPLTYVDPARDEFEIKLIRLALQKKIPILAFCRGFQMVNVALGGSLYQHLPEWSQELQHRPPNGPKAYSHTVQTKGWLQEVAGAKMEVNSWHHQGIDQLASGLQPLAWSTDGLIEAYQSKNESHPVFGVQWHPEILQDVMTRKILSYFLAWAGVIKKVESN